MNTSERPVMLDSNFEERQRLVTAALLAEVKGGIDTLNSSLTSLAEELRGTSSAFNDFSFLLWRYRRIERRAKRRSLRKHNLRHTRERQHAG